MRIVVKIGTATLAHPTGHLNIRRVEALVKAKDENIQNNIRDITANINSSL